MTFVPAVLINTMNKVSNQIGRRFQLRRLFGPILLCLLFAAPAKVPGATTNRFADSFTLGPEVLIVFSGGGNLVAAQHNGDLETLLALGFAAANPHFRYMAWEGDTVYEQRREMNFGSWPEQLKGVGATVVVAQFGQMEPLQGQAGLEQFVEAYAKLLDQFSKQTQRMVLLSPTPFEKAPSPLPDLSLRNDVLHLYVEAIRKLAGKRGCLFVDLFSPFRQQSGHGLHLTDDGFQLNAVGHWAVARETSAQLGVRAMTPPVSTTAQGALQPDSVERLRATIHAKNRLWFEYWRPMNWAFLHGDRTEQPSSRDHRNPALRWFPEEMEKFKPAIEAQEKEISRLAAECKAGIRPAVGSLPANSDVQTESP